MHGLLDGLIQWQNSVAPIRSNTCQTSMNSFLNLCVINLVLRMLPTSIRTLNSGREDFSKPELLSGVPVR